MITFALPCETDWGDSLLFLSLSEQKGNLCQYLCLEMPVEPSSGPRQAQVLLLSRVQSLLLCGKDVDSFH